MAGIHRINDQRIGDTKHIVTCLSWIKSFLEEGISLSNEPFKNLWESSVFKSLGSLQLQSVAFLVITPEYEICTWMRSSHILFCLQIWQCVVIWSITSKKYVVRHRRIDFNLAKLVAGDQTKGYLWTNDYTHVKCSENYNIQFKVLSSFNMFWLSCFK